jgi:flagellar biosynthetic protein FliR
LLIDVVRAKTGDGSPAVLFPLLAVETATGIVIGLLGRLFFAALQFIATAAAQAVGLTSPPGFANEDDQSPALATLLTLSATTLIFVSGQHWELLRGIVDSYATIPPGEGIGARLQLVSIADQLGSAFITALRVGSPFLLYSVIVNFAVAIIGKLTPQIPAYFIAMPLVLTGGLFLLHDAAPAILDSFMSAFAGWLANG